MKAVRWQSKQRGRLPAKAKSGAGHTALVCLGRTLHAHTVIYVQGGSMGTKGMSSSPSPVSPTLHFQVDLAIFQQVGEHLYMQRVNSNVFVQCSIQ